MQKGHRLAILAKVHVHYLIVQKAVTMGQTHPPSPKEGKVSDAYMRYEIVYCTCIMTERLKSQVSC